MPFSVGRNFEADRLAALRVFARLWGNWQRRFDAKVTFMNKNLSSLLIE
jgi:hypothetical protein